MLTPEQVAEFQADGCLLGGQVLTSDEVDQLNAELEQVIAGESPRPPVRLSNLAGNQDHPVWQIVNICDATDGFARLVYHPLVTSAIAQLIGAAQIRLWHDQIQYKPAGVGGVNFWHQDAPFWPVLGADTMVSAWIALDDVDESNGCMSMVPGSHRWGRHWADYLSTLTAWEQLGQGFTPPDGRSVQPTLWPVRRGGVSFHHGLTWHGSHANTSGRPRRAIALHYMDAATPYVAAGEHLMKAFVETADGEPVAGPRFRLVWDHGQPVAA